MLFKVMLLFCLCLDLYSVLCTYRVFACLQNVTMACALPPPCSQSTGVDIPQPVGRKPTTRAGRHVERRPRTTCGNNIVRHIQLALRTDGANVSTPGEIFLHTGSMHCPPSRRIMRSLAIYRIGLVACWRPDFECPAGSDVTCNI